MHDVRSFFTVLFLAGTLAGVSPAIAAEDTSPPSSTSYEVKVLAHVASALAAGINALRDLDGPPIENSNLDRLNVATPGMDCGIDRSLVFIVCGSASLNREQAEAMFARMMDYGRAALSSGSWRQTEQVPRAGFIRNISYQHLKSGAHIDLDLEVYPTGEAEPLYRVRFFGWPRF